MVTLHNRWIDPRITQVRPEAAQAYLLRQGWKRIGPAMNPAMDLFEAPGEAGERTTVVVPLRTDAGPLLQRMIDLIADLSRFEDRWAVEILQEILQQQEQTVSVNGSNEPLPTESTPP